jgi:hypothetical protein
MGLILPNLLGSELVGRLVKIRRELADDSDVGFCGTMGAITALEFLQTSYFNPQPSTTAKSPTTRKRPPRQRLRPNPD